MKKNYTTVLFFTVLLAFQAGWSQENVKRIIDDYRNKRVQKSKLPPIDWELVSYATSDKTRLTQVFAQQKHNNIKIYKAVSSYTLKNNKVIYAAENYVSLNPTQKASTGDLGVLNAVKNAAKQLHLGSTHNLKLLKKKNTDFYILNSAGIALDPIKAELVYYPLKNGDLKLAYNISIHEIKGKHWWSALIDASSGKLLSLNDHLLTCNFGHHSLNNAPKNSSRKLTGFQGTKANSNTLAGESYLVFPLPLESPAEGDQALVTEPQNLTASPYGWHDVNGAAGAEYTITRGNNVYAFQLEPDFTIGDSPDGGAELSFNFPFNADSQPEEYKNASLTNLFYINNKIHDILYFYGFDEASGNFQTNNYGRGRTEDSDGTIVEVGEEDAVLASGQDPTGLDNATFGTDPDGENGIMQMFLWSAVGEPGQPLTLITPQSLAKQYTGYPASFGPSLPAQELQAPLVLGTDTNSGESTDVYDGCDPLTNTAAINNKIAVFRRGSCNFTEKVKAAQEAGALAVIIVNTVDDPIFQMGGEDSTITIPSILISKNDGDPIIDALISGEPVNASLVDVGPYKRDGSLDNVIITHEYGHGVSMRLTGGPDTTDCLETCTSRDKDGNCISSTYTEQMGEGWSDYLGLVLTMQDSDTPEQARVIGNYVLQGENEFIGIRPFPYSRDFSVNPVTYADTNDQVNFSAPHGVGSIWASMLWDLTWDLIDIYGFTPDVYQGEGGNTISLKLVIQALKMQKCQPGFVDGRDALLAADQALYAGKHQCLIWKAFARRGLGVNASQGSALSRLDQTESFDVPEEFQDDCVLGLEELEASNNAFFLFPNPSNEQVTLFINGNFGEGTLRIFDLKGRKVFSQKQLLSDKIEINTSKFAQGVYILQITNKNLTSSKKLIIN